MSASEGLILAVVMLGMFVLGGANAMSFLEDKLERKCLIEGQVTLNDVEFDCSMSGPKNPND